MQKPILFILFNFIFASIYCQQHTKTATFTGANSATILFDAFSKDVTLNKGWGYSSLVEFKGKRILFDAGSNADVFKHNILALNIDLQKLDAVVISHSHYDHLNGIDYLLSINPTVKIYFPHDIFWGAPTLFNARGQDSSARESLPKELQYFDGTTDLFNVEQSGGRFLHANMVFLKNSTEIFPGVRVIPTAAKYMGYFSRYPKSFTSGNFTDDKAGVKFESLPELSLSLQTLKGEIILVGCSHTGVENIIQQVAAETKNSIEMVMGGFHLLPYDKNETLKVSQIIKDSLRVNKVAPGHCTGHLAFKVLKDLYQDNFIYAGLGEKIYF